MIAPKTSPLSDDTKGTIRAVCVAIVSAWMPPLAAWAVDELKDVVAKRRKPPEST